MANVVRILALLSLLNSFVYLLRAECPTNQLADNMLKEGDVALPGSFILSANGQFRATFDCSGNLLVTSDTAGSSAVIWSSHSSGLKPSKLFLANEGYVLAFASDADVIVKSYSLPWKDGAASDDDDECNERAQLVLDDGGVLVVMKCGKAIWVSVDKLSGYNSKSGRQRRGASFLDSDRQSSESRRTSRSTSRRISSRKCSGDSCSKSQSDECDSCEKKPRCKSQDPKSTFLCNGRLGVFSNPDNACSNIFHICSPEIVNSHQVRCPRGLFYDALHNRCDSYDQVAACPRAATAAGVPPAPGPPAVAEPVSAFQCKAQNLFGNFADPAQACTDVIFMCVTEILNAHRIRCPRGQFYDQFLNHCDTFDAVPACSGKTRPATDVAVPAQSFYCTGRLGNFYNVEENCPRTFYICSPEITKAHPMNCPRGLFYNPELGWCDTYEHMPRCACKCKNKAKCPAATTCPTCPYKSSSETRESSASRSRSKSRSLSRSRSRSFSRSRSRSRSRSSNRSSRSRSRSYSRSRSRNYSRDRSRSYSRSRSRSRSYSRDRSSHSRDRSRRSYGSQSYSQQQQSQSYSQEQEQRGNCYEGCRKHGCVHGKCVPGCHVFGICNKGRHGGHYTCYCNKGKTGRHCEKACRYGRWEPYSHCSANGQKVQLRRLYGASRQHSGSCDRQEVRRVRCSPPNNGYNNNNDKNKNYNNDYDTKFKDAVSRFCVGRLNGVNTLGKCSSVYVSCAGGHAKVQSCRSGFAFSSSRKSCVPERLVHECRVIKHRCRSRGNGPHSLGSCKQDYLVCTGNVGILKRCRRGDVFDGAAKGGRCQPRSRIPQCAAGYGDKRKAPAAGPKKAPYAGARPYAG